MRLFFGIMIALMVFVSACATQAPVEEAPEAPEAQVVEEPVMEEEVMEEVLPTTTDVRILEQSAFDPDSLTVSVGDSVTWMNMDSEEAVLLFFKDGVHYLNANKMAPGEKFEHEFTEAGSYQYWRDIPYASDGATVTVE